MISAVPSVSSVHVELDGRLPSTAGRTDETTKLITPHEGKIIDPREPVSKVENNSFRRRKGTLQVFSRSLDIDELGLLGFEGWMIGMVTW